MQLLDRVGRRLKLRDLNILLAVVQAGSMSKAAKLLSVSHPVISKSIAELERNLGVRLLDRTPNGIEPTRFGRTLLNRSVLIFDELRQSIKEIEFLNDPTVGELSVGASEPVAAGIVPAVIARISRQYPRAAFNVEQGDALSLQRLELRERKVEFVIARMLGPTTESDMQAEPLLYERLLVVAGRKTKWVGRRKISLHEIIDEPWIVAPLETLPDSPFVEAFRAAGLKCPAARVLVYSLPLRAHLLATGRFLSLVPGSVMRLSGEQMPFVVLPVELPPWPLPVAIITLKGRSLSPLAQLFIKHTRDIAKSLQKAEPKLHN